MDNYIKEKGILVGTFNNADIKSGRDKQEVQKKKSETGLKYTNQEFVKKGSKIVGLRIYVCTVQDFKI